MPIEFGPTNMLTRLVWETANFASGGGTTTLGWECNDSSYVTFAAAAQSVADAFEAEFLSHLDQDQTLVEVQWESATYSGAVTVNTPGGTNIVGPPPNACVLISHTANGKGPRYRGRTYLPGGIGENNVDERGVIGNTQVANLQGWWETFIDEAKAAGDEIVNLAISQSEYDGQVTTPRVPWPQVLTSTVQPLMATQRRRLRR